MKTIIFFLLLIICSCTPKPKSDENQLIFKLALELNSSTKLWEASNLFKNELAKADLDLGISAGEIKVEFYDQGTIGTERQLLEACYFGVVQAVQVNSSVVTTVQSQFSLLDLPYLFINDQHLQEVLNGEIGEELLNKLNDNGLQGLGFYSAGFRNMFYTAEDCADDPEGLKGMKIRVMESPIMVNAVNALGLSATPIPFSELYQSLKTGVVDGAENSADIFVSYKYYETGCNCFTLTEHFTNQHVIIANKEWLDNLPEKYRKRILKAAKSVVPQFNLIWESAIREAFSDMEENGVTINSVNNKKDFLDKVSEIPDQFFDQNPDVSRELYNRIREKGNKYLTQ